jgi:hypothetical protein
MFENGRFASLDTDFSSFRAWVKQWRQDQQRRVYYPDVPPDSRLLPKPRHVRVVVVSHGETADSEPSESSTSLRLPLRHDITQINDISELVLSPISTNKSNDLAYEPSRILEDKDVLGTRYYLVTWKDLPDERATWLTSDELEELGVAVNDAGSATPRSDKEPEEEDSGSVTSDNGINLEMDAVA